jgi:hypothetical protein
VGCSKLCYKGMLNILDCAVIVMRSSVLLYLITLNCSVFGGNSLNRNMKRIKRVFSSIFVPELLFPFSFDSYFTPIFPLYYQCLLLF